MNNDMLKTFLLVAETKSFHKAAQKLYIAQSTVSSRIQELEKECGQLLFNRKNKSPELTEAGQRLLPYARHLLDMMDSVCDIASPLSREVVRITIGYSDSIYYSYLRTHLPTFILKHPEYSLEMSSSNSLSMLNLLRYGHLDVVISFQRGEDNAFSNYLFTEEELVLVTGIQNLEYTSGVTREVIHTLPMMYSECFLTRELRKWRNEVLTDGHPYRLKTDVVHQLIYLLEHTDCYAFLPRGFVHSELDRHTLQVIPLLFDPPPTLKTYITIRKSDEDNPDIAPLLNELLLHIPTHYL